MVLLKLDQKNPEILWEEKKKIQCYDAMKFLGIWEDDTIDKKAHDE